uniref:Transposase n=1 Tax=Haemonchus placei TaxID=6290 RepID=A0A0N4WRQ2_HAEPC
LMIVLRRCSSIRWNDGCLTENERTRWHKVHFLFFRNGVKV